MSKVIINENETGMNDFLKQSFGGTDDPNFPLWKYVTRVDYPVRQFIKFSGNNKFIEFLTDAFQIEKVKIVVSDFDQKKPKGQRLGKTFEYYLSFYEALRLYESISSGRVFDFVAKQKAKKEEAEKRNETYHMQNAWETIGGKNAVELAKSGKKRDDGKSLFRKLTIRPSILSGYEAAIQIEQGPGKMGKQNGVMPDYRSLKELKGADGYLMVPLTKANFTELAVALDLHIRAYEAAKYAMIAQMEVTNYFKSYFDIEINKQNQMMKILYDQNLKLANIINGLPEKLYTGEKVLPIDREPTDMTSPTAPQMNTDDTPQTQGIVNDTFENDETAPF